MTLIWCLFVILDFDFHCDKNILRGISNLDVSDPDEFQHRSSVVGKKQIASLTHPPEPHRGLWLST